jgi:hypothetical protein
VLSCEFVGIDRLASGLHGLEIRTRSLAPNFGQRKKACDVLARRLQYLLEPVRVIEADADADVIQMRSDPPETLSDGRRYYELRIERDRIMLVRYEKRKDRDRRMVPCILTHEVLGRIVEDVLSTLSDGKSTPVTISTA